MNSDSHHDNDIPAQPDPATGPVSRHTWRNRLLVVVVLVGVVVALLPEALRFAAVTWLDRQPELSARLDDVDFNPFTGLLRIEGLQVTRNGEDVALAELIEVQLDWWPLFKRRLDLEQVTLGNVLLMVEQLPDAPLTIAGLVLSREDSLADETAPPSTGQPWGISSGVVTCDQVAVVLRHRHQDTRIDIDHLTSSPLVSWLPQQAGALDLSLSVAGGTLRCVGENYPFARPARSEMTLDAQNLDFETLDPVLTALGWSRTRGHVDGHLRVQASAAVETQPARLKVEGQLSGKGLASDHAALWVKQLDLSWQGQLEMLFDHNLHLAGHHRLEIGPAQLVLQQPGLEVASGQLIWEGLLTLNGQIEVNGTVEVDDLSVLDLAGGTTLLGVDSGRIGPFAFSSPGTLSVDEFSLARVTLLGRGDVALPRQPQVFSLAKLTGEQVSWLAQQHLSIARLHLSGLAGDVVLLPGGALEARQWLPQFVAQASPQQGDARDDSPPLAVVVGAFVVDGNSQLVIEDQGVTPSVRLHGDDLRLRLGALDSRRSEQRSSVALDARLDAYSRLHLLGDVALFAQPLSLNLTSELSEFQLPSISAYVERGIGYRLEQGQLNLHLEGPVEQGVAALTSQVHLKRLQLRPLTPEDELEVGERLGLPVNMALSLLRDRQGDIALQMPIRGDLSRPDVAMGSIVRKAVVGAVKNTVTLTLAPLGIVAKAGQLVGIGGQLTFQPLVFEPGSTTLTSDSLVYLERVKSLLAKRPQLTLSLCGQVSVADRESLLNSARQRSGETADSTVLSQEWIRQLAMQRAEYVKQLLSQEPLVKSSQLLLCNPPTELVDGPGAVLVRL